MKRSIAILFCFLGLNALVFWITSWDVGHQADGEVEGPLSAPLAEPEELLEETSTSTMVPVEVSEEAPRSPSARPLLLGSQSETRERLIEEVQQGAARAIASMVRIRIYWQESPGRWQHDLVNAVCVDGDGLYATSWARISRGEVFRIQYQDGSLVACELDSFDASKGIALLKSAEPQKSKPAVFASGLSVPFGSALQLLWLDEQNQPQAVRGHLSGVKYDAMPGFPEVISGYLQPDIALRPYQEGGMLVDLEGRMAGLLLDAGNSASSLVLSAEDIRHVCRHLKQLGYVSRSDFGVFTQKLNPDLAQAFGWGGEAQGVVVTRVIPGQPAAQADIQSGDLILELNGRKVIGSGFFQSVLSRWPEGKPVMLKVQQADVIREVELTGVRMPQMQPAAEKSENVETAAEPKIDTPAISGKVEKVLITGERQSHFVIQSVDPRQLIFSPPLQSGDVLIRLAEQAAASKPETGTEAATVADEAQPDPEVQPLVERLQHVSHAVVLCYRNGNYFWSSARSLLGE